MKINDAAESLAALDTLTRLKIFRVLVQAGDTGLTGVRHRPPAKAECKSDCGRGTTAKAEPKKASAYCG